MNPKVEFHTGVADESMFACRLLRKIYRLEMRALVRAPAGSLQRLDRALWTVFEREFIPHLRIVDGAVPTAQAQRTPIWLADGEPPAAHPPVLINLDAEPPARLQDFERIVEIVGCDVDAVRRGRMRWRAYEAAGLRPLHHPATDRSAAGGAHGG